MHKAFSKMILSEHFSEFPWMYELRNTHHFEILDSRTTGTCYRSKIRLHARSVVVKTSARNPPHEFRERRNMKQVSDGKITRRNANVMTGQLKISGVQSEQKFRIFLPSKDILAATTVQYCGIGSGGGNIWPFVCFP